jgi:O-methyltransferase involved in polyketide biosynthesis
VADAPIDLRTDVPHSARVYDYLLGGKDNFPADRAAAEALLQMTPIPRTIALANRQFMRRVTRHLAEREGMRQFLDIGAGIPTSPNLHEVAQEIAPESRVVYVDNDPIVLVHARALLTGTPAGRTAYLEADLHEPETIMSSREVRETLDLDRPVALSMLAILPYVSEDEVIRDLIARLTGPLAKGSTVAITMACPEKVDADMADEAVARFNAQGGFDLRPRTIAETEALLDGFELLPPGIVMINRWHPDEAAAGFTDDQVGMCGGVARKV